MQDKSKWMESKGYTPEPIRLDWKDYAAFAVAGVFGGGGIYLVIYTIISAYFHG